MSTLTMADLGDAMSVRDREPWRFLTGIKWLDARFGDGQGLPLGSGAAIIAPQGGGSTAFGYQLVVSQALQGNPAVLVLSGPDMNDSYRRSLISCATGISTMDLAIRGDDVLATAAALGLDLDLIRHNIDLVQTNIKCVDLVNEYHGDVDAIEGCIKRVKDDHGEKLKVVYFGRAGGLAEMTASRGFQGRTYKGHDLRVRLEDLAYQVSILSARYGVFGAISQAMSVQDAIRSFFTEHSEYTAWGCNLFCAPLQYCFVLGRRDPNTGVQILGVPKARQDSYLDGVRRIAVRYNYRGVFGITEAREYYVGRHGLVALE